MAATLRRCCIGADTTEELDYVRAPLRHPGVCATEAPVRELPAGRRASGPAGMADREGTTGTGLIGAPGYLPVRPPFSRSYLRQTCSRAQPPGGTNKCLHTFRERIPGCHVMH